MFAAHGCCFDTIKYLIEQGANINAKNDLGCTALMSAAAYKSNFNVVRYLVEQGADIHIKNRFGHTALIFAVRYSHPNIVEYLMAVQGHDASIYLSHPNKDVRDTVKELIT